jgi:hypothetical protein
LQGDEETSSYTATIKECPLLSLMWGVSSECGDRQFRPVSPNKQSHNAQIMSACKNKGMLIGVIKAPAHPTTFFLALTVVHLSSRAEIHWINYRVHAPFIARHNKQRPPYSAEPKIKTHHSPLTTRPPPANRCSKRTKVDQPSIAITQRVTDQLNPCHRHYTPPPNRESPIAFPLLCVQPIS